MSSKQVIGLLRFIAHSCLTADFVESQQAEIYSVLWWNGYIENFN